MKELGGDNDGETLVGATDPHERHRLILERQYATFFKERSYFKETRDASTDSIYQRLLAYDDKTIRFRRCQRHQASCSTVAEVGSSWRASEFESDPIIGLTNKPLPGTRTIADGTITVNCLRVARMPTTKFWHYHTYLVEFRDNVFGAEKWSIIEAMQQKYTNMFLGPIIYDGNKSIFCSESIASPSGDLTNIELSVPVSPLRELYVGLRPVGVIDLGALGKAASGGHRGKGAAANLMALLIRMYPATKKHVIREHRAYYVDEDFQSVGSAEFWRGYSGSVRPAIQGYIINIQVSAALMRPRGSLLNAVMSWTGKTAEELCALPRSGSKAYYMIRSYARGLRVVVTHRADRCVERITDITFTSAAYYTFEVNGSATTVSDYFQSMGWELRFPTMPIMAQIGRTTVLPLELLDIEPGQRFRWRVSDEISGLFTKFGIQRPQERFRALEAGVKTLGFDALTAANDRSRRIRSDYLLQAGMEVDGRLMQIPARVLPPPTLLAGRRKTIIQNYKLGSWNMQGQQVFRPVRIEAMAAISVGNVPGTFYEMFEGIMHVWEELGISLPDARICYRGHVKDFSGLRGELDNARNGLRSTGVSNSTILMVVIVPHAAELARRGARRWGDVNNGIATHVLKASNLQRDDLEQFARNNAFKINAKMGGINFVSSTLEPKIIEDHPLVIGLDMSQPHPGSTYPTTASMVFSADENLCDYRGSIKFQEPGQNLFSNLGEWFLDTLGAHLEAKKRTDQVPRRIIVYRGGLSEGSMKSVLQTEVADLLATLREVGRSLELETVPKLTFIAVVKKHAIRFFPRPGSSLADQGHNAVPGTIIDDDITSPNSNLFDYYLQSHASPLGTSRPLRYMLLYDDSRLKADELEQVSHTLCHLCQTKARIMSIPAPLYHAEKLAKHSALLFSDHKSDNPEDTPVNWPEWERRLYTSDMELDIESQERMYWL